MYSGTKFTEDQLVFVVESILKAALDRIQDRLPSEITENIPRYIKNPELNHDEHRCLETAGMALAIIYTQINNDGLSIYDALMCANDFHHQCEILMRWSWENYLLIIANLKRKIDNQEHFTIPSLYGSYWPDCHLAAKEFVKKCFS